MTKQWWKKDISEALGDIACSLIRVAVLFSIGAGGMWLIMRLFS